jgi:N-acyl-D-amino-acid deacylase
MLSAYATTALFVAVFVTAASGAFAQTPAQKPELPPEMLQSAITKSLTLIENSTREYRQQRTCFACHHQAASQLTLAEAKRRGFKIDEENFTAQTKWTVAHLKRGQKSYLAGKGQGGRVDTAGYALWTLEAGDWKPDELTAAVTGYLISYQKDTGHWSRIGNRPPSQASSFTSTYLALRGLGSFGTLEQADAIEERQSKALKWLLETKAKDTEDRTSRLRGLNYLQAKKDAIDDAAKELIDTQRDDGGWAQLDDMKSDAYATATALIVLHEAGRLKTDDEAYRRGVKFLLAGQLEDGSWQVKTRSKPFQKYFESGYPHKKDQFISITASCRATTALLLTLPESAEK